MKPVNHGANANAKGSQMQFKRSRRRRVRPVRLRRPNYRTATTTATVDATIPVPITVTANTSFLPLEKDLKMHSVEVPISAGFGYRIINFVTFFSTLSEMIKCKYCNGNITFSESSICGLGFKLVVTCNNCEPRYINSCPLINDTYEINKRIVFAMRLLGVDYEGLKKFCGIMDLSKVFNKKVYDDIITNVYFSIKAVADLIFSEAATEEKWLTHAGNTPQPVGLIVSGNGIWRKIDFSSLQSVVMLIGHYSGKVIDLIIKSSNCEQCTHWKNKMGTEEYETWKNSHKNDCFANHEESPKKMEVEGIIEMFARSEELHAVKYLTYIGNSESKTFKDITESQPYGENIIIRKKECINYMQKRMTARLRKVKKDTKGLDGNLIDKLCVYYGLAIKRNKDSIEDMRRAIWATLQHKSSTDENPRHENCPPGPDSWCTWQKAKVFNKLDEYTHKPALPDVVLNAITPVYEELSKHGLLERCLGGFTQANIENFNLLIWSLAPKRIKTVEIAAYIAACIFNKGYMSVLLMMYKMNLIIGPNAAAICEQQDEIQVPVSETQTFEISKGIEQQRTKEVFEDVVPVSPTSSCIKKEGPLYGEIYCIDD